MVKLSQRYWFARIDDITRRWGFYWLTQPKSLTSKDFKMNDPDSKAFDESLDPQ